MEHLERKIFVCECASLEHQISFWYDKEDDELYAEIHLLTYRNFFKRAWVAIRYAFGYPCIYGNWDSFIISRPDREKIRTFIEAISQTEQTK
ncbi:MAG TPA: hypothetical protein VFD46_00995 [Chryseolinea sp.]|nr:hypothetical protein [Chryseolinea sp.]